jgi:hypothetical protein
VRSLIPRDYSWISFRERSTGVNEEKTYSKPEDFLVVREDLRLVFYSEKVFFGCSIPSDWPFSMGIYSFCGRICS